MKEKILALLLAKFAGVRKDGLAQLATAIAIQAADETEATALIEKFTAEKVNDFVKDWRKDVDKEVSESKKTIEDNLKKKYDFVEKKEIKDEPENKGGDEPPAWAKALIEQNKSLSEKLSSFEGKKVTETRLQELQSKLSDLPETFKSQKMKDFSRMSFDSDESFNEYLTEVETDITGLKQEFADSKLSGAHKPFVGGTDKNGVSSAVASFIESKTDDKKPLTGKEI
jgi:hypothetical protein